MSVTSRVIIKKKNANVYDDVSFFFFKFIKEIVIMLSIVIIFL